MNGGRRKLLQFLGMTALMPRTTLTSLLHPSNPQAQTRGNLGDWIDHISSFDVVHFGHVNTNDITGESATLTYFVNNIIPLLQSGSPESHYTVLRSDSMVYERDREGNLIVPVDELEALDETGVLDRNGVIYREAQQLNFLSDVEILSQASQDLRYKLRGLRSSKDIRDAMPEGVRTEAEYIHRIFQTNMDIHMHAVKLDIENGERVMILGNLTSNDIVPPFGVLERDSLFSTRFREAFPDRYVSIDLIPTDPATIPAVREYIDLLGRMGMRPGDLSEPLIYGSQNMPVADYILFIPRQNQIVGGP